MNENDMMPPAEPAPEDMGAPAPAPMTGTHMVREPDQNGDEASRALVREWQGTIRRAKSHWHDSFEMMRRNMKFASGKQWPGQTETDDRYVANFTQRHILQRTAQLYAKNPRFFAKRRKTVDFQFWDGTAAQLQQIVQGVAVMDPNAMLAYSDIVQVQQKRRMLDKVAETTECVMDYQLREQIPPFKTQMKQLIRRTLVCAIGYVKIGFDRATQRRPEDVEKITDIEEQISRLQTLSADLADGELQEATAQMAELKDMLAAFEQTPEAVVREGLVFDFPPSWSIIVDPRGRHLGSFLGAQWVAQEYVLSTEDVKDLYGIDLATSTLSTGGEDNPNANAAKLDLGAAGVSDKIKKPVVVWEVQDKRTGMVFTIADGYPDFLQAPAPPTVVVDRFWTLFPLMFNELENDECPLPPSDVDLLRSMQRAHNSAREGLREHRIANRPAMAVSKGAIDRDDKERLQTHPPNAVIELAGLAPGQKVEDLLQTIKKPAIDPSMYETQSIFDDVMKTVGVQEANIGGTSGATATESSIAEGSRMTSTQSNVDDLDDLLSDIGRASSQILFANLSVETVKQIAGAGAVWPEQTRDQIARELLLEVEAGSSGRPNRAAEIANLERLVPLALQIPGIQPEWVARQIVKRMDDHTDFSDAFLAGLPSIQQINSVKQTVGGPPQDNPNNQGAEGSNNAAQPAQTDVGQGEQMPAPGSGAGGQPTPMMQ